MLALVVAALLGSAPPASQPAEPRRLPGPAPPLLARRPPLGSSLVARARGGSRLSNRLSADKLLTVSGLAHAELPADMLAALASGHLSAQHLRNYATLISFLDLDLPPVRAALRCALRRRFLRNRLLLNPQLASILAIEMSVGLATRLFAEARARGASAATQWDAPALALALWTNVALVVALSPAARIGPRAQRGVRGALGRMPASCFQPGDFTPAQRACCLLFKALKFGLGGLGSHLASSAARAAIGRLHVLLGGAVLGARRRGVDRRAAWRAGLAYGSFVGLLASTRYQLVNAVEASLFPALGLPSTGPLATLCSAAVRVANAWVGGTTWVHWNRLLGAC